MCIRDRQWEDSNSRPSRPNVKTLLAWTPPASATLALPISWKGPGTDPYKKTKMTAQCSSVFTTKVLGFCNQILGFSLQPHSTSQYKENWKQWNMDSEATTGKNILNARMPLTVRFNNNTINHRLAGSLGPKPAAEFNLLSPVRWWRFSYCFKVIEGPGRLVLQPVCASENRVQRNGGSIGMRKHTPTTWIYPDSNPFLKMGP